MYTARECGRIGLAGRSPAPGPSPLRRRRWRSVGAFSRAFVPPEGTSGGSPTRDRTSAHVACHPRRPQWRGRSVASVGLAPPRARTPAPSTPWTRLSSPVHAARCEPVFGASGACATVAVAGRPAGCAAEDQWRTPMAEPVHSPSTPRSRGPTASRRRSAHAALRCRAARPHRTRRAQAALPRRTANSERL